MKVLLRVTHGLALSMAASLLVAACGPAATAVPPTSLPTAVPATATALPPTAEPTSAIAGVGTDISQTLPPGDAARGEQLVASEDIGTYTCNECHVAVPSNPAEKGPGPTWVGDVNNDQGIATRAETRYLSEDYTGEASTAEQYLIESIVLPNAYILKGLNYEWQPGKSLHSDSYGQKLTAQDLADIVAYLETVE